MVNENGEGRDECIIVDEDEPFCFRRTVFVEEFDEGEVGCWEG